MVRNKSLSIPAAAMLTCLVSGMTGTVMAEETVRVTGMRMEKVSLYDGPAGKKVSEYARREFKESWPILDTAPNGSLKVKIADKEYWLKAYAVETDKQIHASADCGAVIAAKEPKLAGTRGIGEGCNR